jgi:hypothetical protein
MKNLKLFSLILFLFQAVSLTNAYAIGGNEVMLKARKLFEAGKFSEALKEYDKVPRGSDQWLEAVEEKGWAYHRQKDYQKALAQTKTLLSQAFLPVIGSEPFFLQSLSQLKICDYKSILETHELFKTSQRQRIQDIQNLAKTGESPAVQSLTTKALTFPLTFPQVGEESKALPRQFYRDVQIQKSLMTIQNPKAAQKAIQQARQSLKSRMKLLAENEVEENFKMVQKLNLIEVETIQRIHADQELAKDSFKKGQFKQASTDELVFPDDGHPWIDELDKYEVRVNSCPENIRRKM